MTIATTPTITPLKPTKETLEIALLRRSSGQKTLKAQASSLDAVNQTTEQVSCRLAQRRLDVANAMPPVGKLIKTGVMALRSLRRDQMLMQTCISMGTRSAFVLDLCAEMDHVSYRNL
jgi:hypothetical protein